ncbi:CCD61-like protein [Mya arenaria]|uniref:CCD61-like protein n=1 Tax=Mya arenaria TaxID=6604 RepID=A0ABY7FGQ4_MYAAR|nr:CCD61-like protein [Mya arenaria]
MEDQTVSAAYIFRGIEYIVTMLVKNENTLTVEVEDKLTADQWRADFDAASCWNQASESVSLDLLTYADLESLRQRKSGSAAKQSGPAQRTVALNSKRYLILTYTVEIHYPLPLPYVGKPDPRQLQEQVRALRSEVKTLRQQGPLESKSKDVEKLRKELDALSKEKEDIESEFLQYRREVKNTSQGNAVKVEELRASERNLKIRVKNLTNELALFKRRDRSGSRERERSLSRDRSWSDRLSVRDRSVERPSSANRSRLSERSNSFKNSYRSRTPSPAGGGKSRFDPSAYVRERERKKKEASLKKKRQPRANPSKTESKTKKSSYESDLFDRSAEISEIDERLNRLQQLMKTMYVDGK